MNIHEYQAKEILKNNEILVPEGVPVFCTQDAELAAQKLNPQNLEAYQYVVKVQIHAGGRGKAGGVKIVKGKQNLLNTVSDMLGKRIVTKQTGKDGQIVRRVYVEQTADILEELYLSILIDRKINRICFVVSKEGGTSIEEVAQEHPEKIITVSINPIVGFCSFHAEQIALALGITGKMKKQIQHLTRKLYKIFVEKDASLIEINPLVVTKDDKIICLDAKINFDDNALFRHSDIVKLRDEDEEEHLENQAKKFNLNYIKLDGEIGCMVNGAGLAMATMDIIKLYGAKPANFLDVGGGADEQQVNQAFQIIMADPNVKVILINIFGGIMRCDILAEGVVNAAKNVKLDRPLIVRLEGTNAKEGRDILKNSDLECIIANNLDEAAQKAVAQYREITSKQ